MKPPDVTRKRRKQQPKPSTSERDCTPSTAVEERLHALDGGRDGGKRLATGEEQPHHHSKTRRDSRWAANDGGNGTSKLRPSGSVS